MEFKEIPELRHTLHPHLLILEDLQSMYQAYEEDDDEFDDDDLIAKQNFKLTCDMCHLEIDWYHRYYYKCDLCDYSLHKFCAKLSTSLQSPAHPLHTLHLKNRSDRWTCRACLRINQHGICYHCSTCNYEIDLHCVTFVDQTTIYHPGHPHALINFATVNLILSKCCACGKKHEGVFYHCITCFNFSIHVDCVTLPFKLQNNMHPHMITLSYSFSVIPHHSKCRICQMNISEKLWLYKCSKCRFYLHLDCATSREEPFMSILSSGTDKTSINYDVDQYPNLLQYPLLDESCNILSHQALREKEILCIDHIRSDIWTDEHFKQFCHKHRLVFINADTSRAQQVSLHDPIKRIKLLCNGCVRPITAPPFYMCKQVINGCDFYLHEWCTKLPIKIENHPGHPQHPLTLFHSLPVKLFSAGFKCRICGLSCNGFGYKCSTCNYLVDVNCGFIPKTITHEAHPNHLISLVNPPLSSTIVCHACDIVIPTGELCFKCISCNFYLDNRCALHLPKTIKNKYDKHPLMLSYFPIENHKSQYFCEVCEEDLNPEKWFYHCLECGQSIHSGCAPLILQSEQDVNSLHVEGVYMFLNMKFGGLFEFRLHNYSTRKNSKHKHSLLFLAGVKSDDDCFFCEGELQSSLIFKCLTCKDCFHASCLMKSLRLSKWIFFQGNRGILIKDRETKRIHTRPIANTELTYYPKVVTRPVTRHGKAVDGVIKHS